MTLYFSPVLVHYTEFLSWIKTCAWLIKFWIWLKSPKYHFIAYTNLSDPEKIVADMYFLVNGINEGMPRVAVKSLWLFQLIIIFWVQGCPLLNAEKITTISDGFKALR